MAKKCTKSYKVCAKPLFCSLSLLFSGVLVAVTVKGLIRVVRHQTVNDHKTMASTNA